MKIISNDDIRHCKRSL